MGFEIDLLQPNLARDLRRVVRDQIDDALSDLAKGQGDLPGQIHSLRKRTKKLRALVRMVGPHLGGHRAELSALRDMAQRLAGLRDAEVMLATFDSLGGAPAALRDRLDQLRGAAYGDNALPDRLESVRNDLAALRDRLEDWHLKGKGFALVAPGIRRAFRQAGQRMAAARAQDDPEAIHDWRKRVKDHCYQARILRPIWPEAMAQTIAAASELEEALGQIHDLDVLSDWLKAQPEARLARPLIAEALARSQKLEADCHRLGARLLAGSDADLARRWESWWQAARSEGRAA